MASAATVRYRSDLENQTRAVYVEENLAATNVALSTDEIAYISRLFAPERIVGQRYASVHAVHVANKK